MGADAPDLPALTVTATVPDALRRFREAVEMMDAAKEVLLECQTRLGKEIERVSQAQAVCWEVLTELYAHVVPQSNGHTNGHAEVAPEPVTEPDEAPAETPVTQARALRKRQPFVYQVDGGHRPPPDRRTRARSAPRASDKREAPHTYAHGEKKSAIIDALPGTATQVADRVGLPLGSVRVALSNLVREGLAVKSGRAIIDGHRRCYVFSRSF